MLRSLKFSKSKVSIFCDFPLPLTPSPFSNEFLKFMDLADAR